MSCAAPVVVAAAFTPSTPPARRPRRACFSSAIKALVCPGGPQDREFRLRSPRAQPRKPFPAARRAPTPPSMPFPFSALFDLFLHPDRFRAAAIFAGVPYKCTDTLAGAQGCLDGVDQSPATWGMRVRAAFPGFAGARPRVAVWHGLMDTTVAPLNRLELVQQWTDVAAIDQTADGTATISSGGTRTFYRATPTSMPLVELKGIRDSKRRTERETLHQALSSGVYRFTQLRDSFQPHGTLEALLERRRRRKQETGRRVERRAERSP
jgi:hypothetical protein